MRPPCSFRERKRSCKGVGVDNHLRAWGFIFFLFAAIYLVNSGNRDEGLITLEKYKTKGKAPRTVPILAGDMH